MISNKAKIVNVVIVSLFDNSGSGSQDFIRYADCIVLKEFTIMSARREEIGRVAMLTNPESQWEVDDFSGGPGFDKETRIVMDDVDRNGYSDMILVTRACKAPKADMERDEMGDRDCSTPLVKAEESLEVMLFDPSSYKFKEPVKTVKVMAPFESLWKLGEPDRFY